MAPFDEREWGSLTTRLDQTIHTQRNLRMIVNSLVDDTHALRAEVARIRVMLRTSISVLAVTVAALAWLVEMVSR